MHGERSRKVVDVKGHADLIDAATLRKIAVEASCDPRTVLAVLLGDSTSGLAYQRAKSALVAAGFRVPARGKQRNGAAK